MTDERLTRDPDDVEVAEPSPAEAEPSAPPHADSDLARLIREANDIHTPAAFVRLLAKTPGEVDVDPAEAARAIAAGWTEKDGFDGPLLHAFPLREIAPDAVDYLAEHAAYAARDRNFISSLLGFDNDRGDVHGFFEEWLDIVESCPWLVPDIETRMAMHRLKRTGTRRNWRAKDRMRYSKVLTKLPVSRLRLRNQPDLGAGVGGLLIDAPAPVETAVAAFFEYAIVSYYGIRDSLSHEEFHRLATSLLFPATEARIPEDFDPASAEGEEFETASDDDRDFTSEATEAEARAEVLLAVAPDQIAVAPRLHQDLLETITDLAAALEPTSLPDDIAVLESLAAHARAVANCSARETSLADLLAAMSEAGLDCPSEDDLPTSARDLLRDEAVQAIVVGLTQLSGVIDRLSDAVEAAGAAIQAATSAQHFDAIGALLVDAQALKTQLEIVRSHRQKAEEILGGILSGACETRPEGLHDLQADLDALATQEASPALPFEAAAEEAPSPASETETPRDPDATETLEASTHTPEPAAQPDPIAAASPDTRTALTFEAEGSMDPESVRAAPALRSDRKAPEDRAVPRTEQTVENASAPARRRQEALPVPALPERIGPDLFADLISRDRLIIAADLAGAMDAYQVIAPLSEPVLRAAAGARAPHRDFGSQAQRFLTLIEKAQRSVITDQDGVLLFGALLRPAVMQPAFGLRPRLSDLARGALGQHLRDVVEVIDVLEFDFPPDPDTLAALSGTEQAQHRDRIAGDLEAWCDEMSRKSSRWRFATAFLRHVASPEGPIGAAVAEIKAGAKEAKARAEAAIAEVGSPDAIVSKAEAYAASLSDPSLHLYPRGVEYLDRQFSEACGLLADWLETQAAAHEWPARSEEQLRQTLGRMRSRLEAAAAALRQAVEDASSQLDAAMAEWLASQIESACTELSGISTHRFATLDAALEGERDLLPAPMRHAFAESQTTGAAALVDFLGETDLPDPEDALEHACVEGAFETAARLKRRFGISLDQDDLTSRAKIFAEDASAQMEKRLRRLSGLIKIDYDHQEELARRISWARDAIDRLRQTSEEAVLLDLDDLREQALELDRVADEIEDAIRLNQQERIRQHRTVENAEEADAILASLDELTAETIEDRIAQLRDGRSAAAFEEEDDDLIDRFTPAFVEFAASSDWPGSARAFDAACAAPGLLFTEEDRRPAALDLMAIFRGVRKSLESGQPAGTKIKALFDGLGFERAQVSGITNLGRGRGWKMTLNADVRPDGWFLPPVFGSQATSGYTLIVLSTGTLPEMIRSALEPDRPTVLLIAGVADRTRRHEFAERLRAASIPALLIDEALVSFAATRRETRVRTVFSCGLPYGRVEPYTTDAGHAAEEMFFGRRDEIRKIMSKSADGCLVYGGRQLGKSALLNHVSRTQHNPAEGRIVVRRDVKSLGNAEPAAAIWEHLNAMLAPLEVVNPTSRSADTVARDIRSWILGHERGQIVCLFDETDHFMTAETKADYPEIIRLKELMEDTGRAFKVVFAGLHNVQRVLRQPNSPLAHLGTPICIGPLNRTPDDKRAAYELVVAPMRAAGFRFESPEAPEEILAWTNHYPSLVQEYAKGLLASLHGAGSGKEYRLSPDGPLWTVPNEALFAHRGFGQIEAKIREKFHLTLELDPRYALVAYTLAWLITEGQEHKALVSGFRAEDLLEHTTAFWPKTAERPTRVAFEALLDEMFDLGVLGKVPIPGTQRARYCLRTRQVAAMLGGREDVETALLEIESHEPTVAYDRTIYRRHYAPKGRDSSVALIDRHYAPLTDFQIERLCAAGEDRAPVRLVAGLDLLGLGRVGRALTRLAERGSLPGAPREQIEVQVAETLRDVRQALDRARAGARRMQILVHAPSTTHEADRLLERLDKQPKVLGGHVRPIILLDTADAAMRMMATRRQDQAEFLAPWGAEMLRVHLAEIEQPGLDTPQMRERILEASGGIPAETLRIVKALAHAVDPDATLAEWDPRLKVPDAIATGSIGRALGIIEECSDPATYAAIDDLLRGEIGKDLVTIGPDLVAMGLVSTWAPSAGRLRLSALGRLLARRLAS